MKNILLIGLFVLISLPLIAQKPTTLKVKSLRAIMSTSDADIGPIFLKAGKKATETEEDDCTPPPCTGIIDPWTCECHSDLKDPWENEQIASQMRAAQQFEAAIKRGEGKNLFPPSIVDEARKKYPGKSLKAIVSRLNYYSAAVK